MGHEITPGTRVVTIGESAWHNIVNNFQPGTKMTTVEAVGHADMDHGLERESPVVTFADGSTMMLPDKATFLRKSDGTREYLGVQSAEFTPITNMELAEMIDATGFSREFPLETAGSLKDGRWTFFTYNVGMTTIGGENVGQYVAINDGKDGSRSLTVMITDVREVCANTVNFADASSRLQIQLVHRPSVRGDFEIAVDLIAAVKRSAERMKERMEELTRKYLDRAGIEKIFEAAYPYTPRGGKARILSQIQDNDPGKFDLLTPDQKAVLIKAKRIDDNAASRAMERRKAAYENYERICSTTELLRPELRGTAWAAWNALTEMENHRAGWGEVAESILVGDRNKAMLAGLEMAERL